MKVQLTMPNGDIVQVEMSQGEINTFLVNNDEFKVGDKFFSLLGDGSIPNSIWSKDPHDLERLSMGMVFKTEKEAEIKREYMGAEATLRREIKKLNDGWVPNWGDTDQRKYAFYLNEGGYMECACNLSISDIPDHLQCKSKEIVEQIIENYESEIRTYLKGW